MQIRSAIENSLHHVMLSSNKLLSYQQNVINLPNNLLELPIEHFNHNKPVKYLKLMLNCVALSKRVCFHIALKENMDKLHSNANSNSKKLLMNE